MKNQKFMIPPENYSKISLEILPGLPLEISPGFRSDIPQEFIQ